MNHELIAVDGFGGGEVLDGTAEIDGETAGGVEGAIGFFVETGRDGVHGVGQNLIKLNGVLIHIQTGLNC